MKHFLCGYGKLSLKSYLAGRSWQFCRIKRRHFQVIGHPAEFGWKHIPYVLRLIVERLLLSLSDCRCQTISAPTPLCICVCVCLFVCTSLCAIICTYKGLLTSKCTRVYRMGSYRNCLCGTCNWEPLFQPCSHPAASKQQMAGLDAVADLDRLCLLGSNCVLTWRETKYYSQAGKQIIVTSLAGRWLYLSHVQMEFEEKKLAQDVAWAGCT